MAATITPASMAMRSQVDLIHVIPSAPFDRLPSVALGTGRTGKASEGSPPELPSVALGTGRTGKASEGSPPELCYGMVSLAWRLLAA